MFGRGRWNARGISKAKLKPDLYGLQCLHRNFLHWESLLPAPSTPTAAPGAQEMHPAKYHSNISSQFQQSSGSQSFLLRWL